MIKFAYDTSVSEYIVDHKFDSPQQKIKNSIVHCTRKNKFQSNTSKYKETFASFKRSQPNFSPIIINRSGIERVEKITITIDDFALELTCSFSLRLQALRQ